MYYNISGLILLHLHIQNSYHSTTKFCFEIWNYPPIVHFKYLVITVSVSWDVETLQYFSQVI